MDQLNDDTLEKPKEGDYMVCVESKFLDIYKREMGFVMAYVLTTSPNALIIITHYISRKTNYKGFETGGGLVSFLLLILSIIIAALWVFRWLMVF